MTFFNDNSYDKLCVFSMETLRKYSELICYETKLKLVYILIFCIMSLERLWKQCLLRLDYVEAAAKNTAGYFVEFQNECLLTA